MIGLPLAITIDGNLTPEEWSSYRLWRDTPADSTWNSAYNEIYNLYVYWDSNYIYIGVSGKIESTNSFLLYIDTPWKDGATSLATVTAWDRNVVFEGGLFEADFQYGNYGMNSGNTYNKFYRVYPDATTEEIVAGFAASSSSYSEYPGWEIQISWGTLFGNTTTTVPKGAYIKICAVLAPGSDDENAGGDSLPNNINAELPVMDNFVVAVIDSDYDGMPDDPSSYDITDSPPVVYSYSFDPPAVYSGFNITAEVHLLDGGYGFSDEVYIDFSSVGGGMVKAEYSYSYSNGKVRVYKASVVAGSSSASIKQIIVRTTSYLGNREGRFGIFCYGVQSARSISDSLWDDWGPGSYTYPAATYTDAYGNQRKVFPEGSFDLTGFNIYWSSDVILFEVSFRVMELVGWNGPSGFDLQKVDIFIDSSPGGLTDLLPGRNAYLQKADAWDYAVVADSWWSAVIDSTLDVHHDGVWVSSDLSRKSIFITVNATLLGSPSVSDIASWDILVASSCHGSSESNDSNFASTREVYASTSEWNFGGGRDDDADPNFLDIITSPGQGKSRGLPQEVCLDWSRYSPPRAVITIEEPKDVSPPQITDFLPYSELKTSDGKIYFPFRVEDESEVSVVSFWYGNSSSDMKKASVAGPDSFGVYLAYMDLSSFSTGDAVYMRIYAEDKWGNSAWYPSQSGTFNRTYALEAIPDYPLKVSFSETTPSGEVLSYVYLPFPVRILPLDSGLGSDFSVSIKRASEVWQPYPWYFTPASQAWDVTVYKDGKKVYELSSPIRLDIFTGFSQSSAEASKSLGRWEPDLERWIPLPGFSKNLWVCGYTTHLSTFSAFVDARTAGKGEFITRVSVDPNPFSPNGDGYFDESGFTFSVSASGKITMEIYSQNGVLVQTFCRDMDVSPGSEPVFYWDGTDSRGNHVPMGIYFLRVHFLSSDEKYGERKVVPVVVLR